MAGMGIHRAFELPIKETGYYETIQKAERRAKQFDADMERGKAEAFRVRQALREIEKRKASR